MAFVINTKASTKSYAASCLVFHILCLSWTANCHSNPYEAKREWGAITQTPNNDHETPDESFKLFHFTNSFDPEPTKANESPPKINKINDRFIPDAYKIIALVKTNTELSQKEIVEILCQVIANVLHIPVRSLKFLKLEKSRDIYKVYLVHAIDESPSSFILLPANSVVSKLPISQLQNETNAIKIISMKAGEKSGSKVLTSGENFWNIFNDQNWNAWQLAIIISCCLFALFCIFVIFMLFLGVHNVPKNRENVVENCQVIVHPVLKPKVTGINTIQPENKDCYITETDSEHTSSPSRSPMRMKGKGLLERRGSNASLTLDLNRSQESIHYVTPPKECSAEEYLLSAGNRLTRKQLRNSLKDVKALYTEFWEIPMNHPERVEVAGSGTKNRYKTILPNESTRVSLKGNEDGDPLITYINANYIRGYSGESKAYVATQGPMAHTVSDFWKMVWDEKSPIIVMITKLKEKYKVKCEPYIPDHKGQFGDLDVTVLKVIPRDGYTIRELLLSDGEQFHTVYHFWYTTWPDHKTPATAKQMLAMVLDVEALRHDSNGTVKGPAVVHCSAGIGRTGCFIAVSIGIQQLIEENMVDILGIVCGLRLDRGGMVQTAEQYEFVHQGLGIFEQTMPYYSGE